MVVRLAGTSLTALALCLATGVAARAQVAEEATVPEVTVTAQFRDQALQSTPLAITAVSGAMIQARGQINVIDLAEQAPNVTLKPGASPYGPSLQAFIRGIGQTDFNYAFEPGVGLYVDDVYYSTLPGSMLDLLDLDRVEILRGPQGTLAGQNAIGGAIKLYSKKPNGQGGGFLEAGGGSLSRVGVRGAADFTVVPDKLFARVSGAFHRQDGYVTRYDYGCTHPGSGAPATTTGGCKLGTEGGKSYEAVRLALRWTPTPTFEANLAFDYTHDDSEVSPMTLVYVGHTPSAALACPGGAGICPFPASGRTARLQYGGIAFGGPAGSPFVSYSPFGPGNAADSFSRSPYASYSTYADPNPLSGAPAYALSDKSGVSGGGLSLSGRYKITDDVSLTSITAYRYYDGGWSIDQDGTPAGAATVRNTVWHRQLSQELRLNGRLAGAVDYTLGGFYLDQTSHYGGRIDFPTVGLDFIENDRIPETTWALFGTADWSVTERLHLIGGLRYTDVDKSFTYGRLGVPGNLAFAGGPPPSVAPLNNLTSTFKGERPDWRAAVQYQWTPAVMTYGQVSTGFKGGGINPRPFFPAQGLPHNPETLTAYEVGLKSRWLENRLQLNLAAFWNRYDDILVSVNACPLPGAPAAPCSLPVNAGKANIKGFEAEAVFRPTSRLSFDASLSTLDFEYRTLSAAALASGLNLGMTAPFAPDWKASLGAQYAFDIGRWGSLTPRLDVSHQSSFNAAALNTPFSQVPSYTLANARLTWSDRNGLWQATAEVTNLGDELYYSSLFDNRGLTQTVFGVPAAPREWFVKLRRNF